MHLIQALLVCIYNYIYIYIYPVVMATLKDGSSRLDRDATGTKKPLSITGALKSR